MSTPNPGPSPSTPTPPAQQRADGPRTGDHPSGKAVARIWLRILSISGADPADPQPAPAGRWPDTRQTLLWDLSPGSIAPNNDGVVAPATIEVEPWLPWLEALDSKDKRRSHSRLAELIEVEQRRHERARERVDAAEGKASRLLTPCVGLLAAAVAFVSWQLHAMTQAKTGAGTAYLAISAFPGVIGVLFLISCIVRALDTDIRVGIYKDVGAAHLVNVNDDQLARLRLEHEAAQLARWTSVRKSTGVMLARAALSRALVSLTLALTLATAAALSPLWSSTNGSAQKELPSKLSTKMSLPTTAPSSPVHPTGTR
jgi:hypothetical protein